MPSSFGRARSRSSPSRCPLVRSVVRWLAGALWGSRDACADAHPDLEVRLLVAGEASAQSDEVEAILAVLRRSGRMRLDALVRAGAGGRYPAERAPGGAHADLGLLG